MILLPSSSTTQTLWTVKTCIGNIYLTTASMTFSPSKYGNVHVLSQSGEFVWRLAVNPKRMYIALPNLEWITNLLARSPRHLFEVIRLSSIAKAPAIAEPLDPVARLQAATNLISKKMRDSPEIISKYYDEDEIEPEDVFPYPAWAKAKPWDWWEREHNLVVIGFSYLHSQVFFSLPSYNTKHYRHQYEKSCVVQ